MTLVLGGIRSGKSQYAEQIAAGFGGKILYVATAEVWPGAGSMEYRVRKHRERRPESWLTLECPRHVASAVRESGLLDQVDGVILECVTLLASNTLYAQKDPTDYEPPGERCSHWSGKENAGHEAYHHPVPCWHRFHHP